MPRRRRDEGALVEFADAFQGLPLKVGVAAAAVLAGLAWLLPVLFPRRGIEISGSLAVAGSVILWVVAFMVMMSALVGAARRAGGRRLFDSKVDLADLSWTQFEGYLAEYFRRRGSAVTHRGGATADGGVDLVLEGPAGRRILQAKHWRARDVGVSALRELWGVREDEGAQGAVFVTSGRYTRDAREFAQGKNLELIDGDRLRRLIAEVKGSGAPVSGAPAPQQMVDACPQCGRGTLGRKLAKRGAKAGSYFLGCSRYPNCRYTRDA